MERIRLLHGDCMDLMRDTPDKFYDLAIVDPPYGINADKKNSTNKKQMDTSAASSKCYGQQEWDKNIPDASYFSELKRVSKHQIIWGANYFGLSGGYIYWHKNVSMPTYSDGELAYCSLINRVQFVEYTWHGMIQEDMKNKQQRIHPTEKPIKLYQWLLDNYATPDMHILDTHLGSGSSAIAAHYYGCKFTGIEIDKDYYDAAVKRFNLVTRQTTLF